jgi:hypothetical protein
MYVLMLMFYEWTEFLAVNFVASHKKEHSSGSIVKRDKS